MRKIVVILTLILLANIAANAKPTPSIGPYLGLKGSFIPETISEPVDIGITLEIGGHFFIPMKNFNLIINGLYSSYTFGESHLAYDLLGPDYQTYGYNVEDKITTYYNHTYFKIGAMMEYHNFLGGLNMCMPISSSIDLDDFPKEFEEMMEDEYVLPDINTNIEAVLGYRFHLYKNGKNNLYAIGTATIMPIDMKFASILCSANLGISYMFEM